jgi:gluconokinase
MKNTMQYFIGVDIGTTSVKSVAFNGAGNVLHIHATEYAMQHPLPGTSEQNALLIFDAFIDGLQKNMAALNSKPAFVAFSAAMHSLMAVDENGKPITPLIIWADNRAAGIAEKLHTENKAWFYYEKTGVPVHPMSPLCKLMWMKENEAFTWHRAYKFIGIKEYIFYRLFGQFVVDTSVASATGLLNTTRLQWDDEILSHLDLPVDKLSKVVSAKQIYFTGEDYPSFAGIPFVIGASDGALANLGTHAIDDIMAVTIGTSGAARMMVKYPLPDEQMRTFCYHVKDDRFIIGGAGNNGAVVLQWLKENIFENAQDFEVLFEKASAIAAGADGLIMLPYLLGERAPIWNAGAKAVLFGLTKNHWQAHIIRAAMEAVIFSVYDIASVIMQTHGVTCVHASGGFAQSRLWLQILANVFNLPVFVNGAYEAAAYGAVILGAEALQIEANFEHRTIDAVYPAEAENKIYMACFEKYRRLYVLLKDEMNH